MFGSRLPVSSLGVALSGRVKDACAGAGLFYDLLHRLGNTSLSCRDHISQYDAGGIRLLIVRPRTLPGRTRTPAEPSSARKRFLAQSHEFADDARHSLQGALAVERVVPARASNDENALPSRGGACVSDETRKDSGGAGAPPCASVSCAAARRLAARARGRASGTSASAVS